ncbi:MAG: CCA tRNA nucleotidyltransferase, partial [Candidatus Heimdallarchaeota archaeon]|nr:CCA tRNA nucleotidyltransferase [Candidatus Heimdallarchaeota archaeon]
MIEESETSYNLCIDELKKNNITAKIHEISDKNLQIIDSAVQDKIESVYKIASQAGGAIGVIGGFVRDLLLGNASHDVDFVVFQGNINKLTELIGHELNGKIGKMSNQTLTTQIRFPDGIIFEFNSTRKEHYEHPSRMPIVEKGTLVDDLFRRDFTINAFIMFGNKYIDVFDGTNDLQNLIIQTTREPTVVFREDYLRMFRAIRFSCMLNFEIDKRVKEGIRKSVEHLKFVPHERILDELKSSISSNPLRAFRLMVDLNIFETIFPEIKNYPLEKSSFLPDTVWKKIEQKLRYMLDNKITDSTFLIAVILLEFDLDMTLEK